MTSRSDAMAEYARQVALEQRARLLDAVWDDVCDGHRAVLPAWLLGAAASRRGDLESYGADLICCPDGVWRVMRDHVGRHPGATLLEAPLLAAFLPALCRLLLGETLRLASVPVWWLGDRESRSILVARFGQLAIRDSLDPSGAAITLANLGVEQRTRLQAAIDLKPDQFVAGLELGWRSPIQRVTLSIPVKKL